jgi:hypothetical protein
MVEAKARTGLTRLRAHLNLPLPTIRALSGGSVSQRQSQ